jgi:nitroimidazol reductase NimA-like FMN-containing flavoprotein (pyridoxamine 5'-phosphate oxidase superfamily)
MTTETPSADLDKRFSSPDATAVSWQEAEKQLEKAEVYWLSTIRPEGRPHVTTLMAVWLDGALYFSTGENERKAKNLLQNKQVAVTTGCNLLTEGLDIVVEGDAVRVSDDAKLRRIADQYVSKYGEGWRYTVRDGFFYHNTGNVREEDTSRVLVFEVAPTTVFGFGKGFDGDTTYSQTRWQF